MAYNRLPYQPYDDNSSHQPYSLGYPQELPYQEEYPPQQQQMPYDAYNNYPMNPYVEPAYPDYREPLPRRDGWDDPYSRDYPPRGGPPLDYDDDAMTMDYRDPASERPRESWAERNERDITPSFSKRDPDDRPRRNSPFPTASHLHNPHPPMPNRNNLMKGHEPYRPRRPPSDRPSNQRNLDPYTLDHIVPFTYFCDWYKQANARTLSKNADINKDELQESFIKYQEDLLARTAKGFVKEHITDAWFREKYDPAVAPVTRGKLVGYRRFLYEKFMEDLDAGTFDELTLDGAAARRYYAEKSGQGSPSRKDEDEDTSSTAVKMPSDPMAQKPTPCIKTISTTVSRIQLEWLLEDVEGFNYLSVSDPNPSKKFARVGWVIVRDPANPEEVLRHLDDKRIHDDTHGDFIVHCTMHSPAKEQPRKALSDIHSTSENISRDLQLAEFCAKKFEKELGEGYKGYEKIRERVKMLIANAPKEERGDDEEEGAVKEDEGLELVMETKKILDLTVEYFRRVYSFCFYCISENDSVHELQRKCFAGHFRRPPPQTPDTKISIMQKAWVDKLNLFINPDQADVIKLGGVSSEDAINKEITAAISREAEDRWRCTVRKCTKLFLEEKFVRSHIQKRHKDWLEQLAAEAAMLNNYVRDPCRVLPLSVEQPPPGFGLNHRPEKEYNAPPRFEPPPSVIPTFTGFPQFSFGQGMFDAPPEWNNPGGGYPIEERSFRGRRNGPGGPMRRGTEGGRDHPYERRAGWSERRDNGDGAGYPIERTRMRETRPLRSYRDLDAPQEATPELNY